MSTWLVLTVAFGVFALLAGCLLGWQLLRQNGRLLLRLDELEKRVDGLEFGERQEPAGLPLGTEAPAFELPDLAGGRKSLAQFRGQPVLLVFFNPDCGFCRELVPKLAAIQKPEGRGQKAVGEQRPLPLIVSTGDAERNRQFFADHKVGCPVLLQNDEEVAKAYTANGTPTGYLVSGEGKIGSELAVGAKALMKLADHPAQERPLTPALSPSDGEKETTGGDRRAHRFSQRSVVRSKIKRDGLKAGTLAPDFRLPRLNGRGDFTLSKLRGKRVLLVFSSPNCDPCSALAPELEKFHRSCVTTSDAAKDEVGGVTPCAPPREGFFQNGAQRTAHPTLGINIVMISKGEPKENRAKVEEHGLTFPVVLQQQWEISRRYAMFATPIAYLIDEAGVLANDVAVGVEPILALLNSAALLTPDQELAMR